MRKNILQLLSIKKIIQNIRYLLRRNVKIRGKNNKIFLVSSTGEKEIHSVYGFKISISGNNNVIRIPEGYNISGKINITTDNCLIEIKSTNKLHLTVHTHDHSGQNLVIGPGTTIFGASIFLNEQNASVIIGKNCLFSGNIAIWATDGHSIIDNKTGTILNHIQHPITIEDNCWIGCGVMLTKNAYLSSNSIVGAGSVVTKEFKENNVIIAGNPAKIIKTGVSWNEYTPALLEEIRLKENI